MNTLNSKKTFLVNKDTYKDFTLEEMVIAYTPLAKIWCRKYHNTSSYEYEDMLQETNIAIIKAFNAYTIDFNISIGHYLNKCIKNALRSYCSTEKYKRYSDVFKSLDEKYNDESATDGYTFAIDPKSTSELDRIADKMYLFQLFKVLNDNEKLILKKIYVYNNPQQQIANELSLTQAQISRIKSNSLRKIKEYSQQIMM